MPESNEKMKNSYLILDEKMRFLNCQDNSKNPSKSILNVGVQVKLLKQLIKFILYIYILFCKGSTFRKWMGSRNVF